MKKAPMRHISIKTLLQGGNIGLLIIAMALVFILGFGTATENTLALQAEKAHSFAEAARLHIEYETDPIQQQSVWISQGFANGDLSLHRQIELGDILSGTSAGTPNLDFMAVMNMKGAGLQFDVADDAIPSPIDWSDDEEVIDVLEQSSAWREGRWLPPYWIPEMSGASLIYVTPLYRNARQVGMLIQAKNVLGVSERLAQLGEGDSYVPYILYKDFQVIAHRSLAKLEVVGRQGVPLPMVSELNDPVMAARSARKPVNIQLSRSAGDYEIGRSRVGGINYAYLETMVDGFSDRPLTVGFYFDEQLETAALAELFEAGVVAIIVFVLAVAAVVYISRKTANPIVELAQASRSISNNKLDEFKPLRHSHLKEIEDAFQAFNAMVEGMRERSHIRELFGRMVPEKVAERLLSEPEGLKPQSSTATVLFCDIVSFTAISEKIEPEKIIELLNAYFSDMVEIIERHGGIITQFQGDAILAVFNVPVHAPDHARQAITAAREMQEMLAGSHYAGLTLSNRIGINTGHLVAGNVGAEKRMNYTVHGDAVNTAARLEQMNKEYGTSILIGEATMRQAGMEELKFVANAAIRGKDDHVDVFTV